MLKIRRTARATSEITIASMSDIAFLLIIFFLVTSVFIIKEGLHLIMPDKNREPLVVSSSEVLTLTVQRDSSVLLNGKRTEKAALLKILSEEHEKRTGVYVMLRISGDVPYENAIEVIDIVKLAGMKKLSIRTL